MRKTKFVVTLLLTNIKLLVSLQPSTSSYPPVGDITIRYDPPRRGRVIPMMIHDVKPMRISKIAVHGQGPKAQGRLKAVKPPYV